MECVAEGRNPVGESPTSCALVLFEKPNLMHHREVMCEGDAVFERTVGEISGRNRSENRGCGSRMCDDIAKGVEVYLLYYHMNWSII